MKNEAQINTGKPYTLNFYTTSERDRAFRALRENSIKSFISSFASLNTTEDGLKMLRKNDEYNFIIDMR